MIGLGRLRRSRKAPSSVACPYCGRELPVVPEAVSIPCSKCSRRVDLEDLEVVENISRDLMTGASVLVRTGATVAGSIHAAEITVMGHVRGNLRASRIIRLSSSARIMGDICAPILEMEEGAHVVGKVAITRETRGSKGR